MQPYATQLLLKHRQRRASIRSAAARHDGPVAPRRSQNPDLKWETSEQTNVGLDWGFKNDRITGVIDIYQKKTKDLLLTVPVPQPAVVSHADPERRHPCRTAASRRRSTRASSTRRTSRSPSGLVLSVERNKVTSLGATRRSSRRAPSTVRASRAATSQRIIPGQPLGTFWGAKFLRVNAQGQQVFACTAGSTGCVNGETIAPTGDDEMIIGNANPNFTLGLRSNGGWGNFDASWLWRGEFGRDVFNNTALVYSTKGDAKSGPQLPRRRR